MIDFALVAILNPRNQLLLQERDEFAPNDPNLWSLPGGGVESGESTREAAIRELEEETGLRDIELASLLVEDVTFPGDPRPLNFEVFIGFADRGDADVTCGEGRQMVFVDLAAMDTLPLAQATAKTLARVVAHPRPVGWGRRENEVTSAEESATMSP